MISRVAGQFLGTPDFMAPEQITNAQSADILADIYSLGCTLYYLLSGRPPFQAQKLDEVLKAHRSTDARLLNFVRQEVPAELAAVAAKMMAKDPLRRYQTPTEVAQALVPFFTPRTTAVVSPDLAIDPVIAADASRSRSEPIPPEDDSTAASAQLAEKGPRMWSSLIEFKKTEHDADAVAGVVETGPRATAAVVAGGRCFGGFRGRAHRGCRIYSSRILRSRHVEQIRPDSKRRSHTGRCSGDH